MKNTILQFVPTSLNEIVLHLYSIAHLVYWFEVRIKEVSMKKILNFSDALYVDALFEIKLNLLDFRYELCGHTGLPIMLPLYTFQREMLKKNR
jgi:hypothetical protein